MVMQLDYYFSVPEWRSAESNASEVPVLLRLQGHRPSYVTPGANHTFDHYYAFNHFRVGPINGWSENQFYVSEATPCTGNITTQPEWALMGDHQGFCEAKCGDVQPHGGVYFGFVVLGAAIAVVVAMVASFVCGRRYESFKPMVNEVALGKPGEADGKPAVELKTSASGPVAPRIV